MHLTPDDVPEVVRAKARVAGVSEWVERVPALVEELGVEWGFDPVRALDGGTEAFVAEVVRADGSPAVLKLLVPGRGDAARHEITVLRLADCDGCPRLFRADPDRDALLMERLGPSMADLAIPVQERHALLCRAAARLWRPAPDSGLPTGADKGRWLVEFVTATWETLGRPVSVAVVDHAVSCAERRIAAYRPDSAVLVHGDVHQWNALADPAGDGFRLVDPDGLLAEPEYDLGILMREDPVELLEEGHLERAARLAGLTGTDPVAIAEWGVVERVSTGLICLQIGLEPFGSQMLAAAEVIARSAG